VKTISDIDILQWYKEIQTGGTIPSFARVEYEYDGVWYTITDVIGGQYNANRENDRSGVYAILPPNDTFSFSVSNSTKRFYPSSVDGDVLLPNRKIRFYTGYHLPSYLESNATFTVSKWYGNNVSETYPLALDYSIGENMTAYETGIALYNSGFYGTDVYGSSAVVSKPFSTFSYANKLSTVSKLSITANGSSVAIHTRYFTGEWSAWTSQGNTINGTKEIALNTKYMWYQVAFVFVDNATTISDVMYTYKKAYIDFLIGEFLILKPEFDIVNDVVDVTCYNVLRRAFDAEPTTKKYEPTDTLYSTFISDVLESIGVSSEERDIATTTGFNIRKGITPDFFVFEKTRSRDIFENAIEALQVSNVEAGGERIDWRMFFKDGKITLSTIPADNTIDFAISRTHSDLGLKESIDYERQISYVTVMSNSNTYMAGEGEVKAHNVSSYNKSDVVDGILTVSFDNTSFSGADYIFAKIRPDIDTSGGDYVLTETSRDLENKQMTFSVTGTTGDFTCIVYAAVIFEPNGFIGESAGSGANQHNGYGEYLLIENVFIKSHAEAKALAEYIYNFYSNAKSTISGNIVFNPIIEINDTCIARSNNYIYVVAGIGFKINHNLSVDMNVTLIDNGISITDITYDFGGKIPTVNDFYYDSGVVYDFTYLEQGIDNDPVNTPLEFL